MHKIQLIIVAHETLTDVNTHQCRNKESINLFCQKQLLAHISTSTHRQEANEEHYLAAGILFLDREKIKKRNHFVQTEDYQAHALLHKRKAPFVSIN